MTDKAQSPGWEEYKVIIEHLKRYGFLLNWMRVYDADRKLYIAVLPKHQVEWLRSYAYIHRVVSMNNDIQGNQYGCEIIFSMKDPNTLPAEDLGHQISGDPPPMVGPSTPKPLQN